MNVPPYKKHGSFHPEVPVSVGIRRQSVSKPNHDSDTHDLERQGLEELMTVVRRYREELVRLPPNDPNRGQWVRFITEANRMAGWPDPRTVTLVSPDQVMGILELRVVPRLTGGPLEITEDQERRFREIEEKNNGTIPVTREEFDVLQDGDVEKFVELARKSSSNLHPLFNWDDAEVAALARFVRMFGAGN
jgi:hypothetical protein